MTEPRPSMLSTNGLSIGYGKGKSANPILKNLNLSIYPGQLICLLGPNGAGKSTLLRTLAGVQPALGGKITMDGHDHSKLSRKALAELVSLVLTDALPPSQLTVEELVALGRYPYTNWSGQLTQEDLNMVQTAIQQTQLTELVTRPIHQLSDGQFQKAMIARALAQNGQVMILDEPTSHLDLNNQWAVMNLLRSVAGKTKKAILVATHQLELALQTADQFWLINSRGRMTSGYPEDLAIQGIISETFFQKEVRFDLATGKFQFNATREQTIKLSGKGQAWFWTAAALTRNGYRLEDEADKIIIIEDQEGTPCWKFNGLGFTSIEDLLLELNREDG